MEYRRLGNSGLKVSVIGLGTNNFGRRMDDVDNAARIIHTAVEHGVNLLDTADVYGGDHRSEEFIGRAVKGMRSQVLIATKVGRPMDDGPNSRGASRLRIIQGLDASLRALGVDYIDLFQIHGADPHTPIEETLRALDDVVRSGKVRYIGCSNYSSWQLCEALWVSRTQHLEPFVSEQPLYNMLEREIESDLVPFCQKYSIGILPYYPLAGGFLTGKYRRGEPIPEGSRMALSSYLAGRYLKATNFDLIDRLQQFSEERGHPIVDLAFAWLLANHQISSVIAGASSPEQVKTNVLAGDWQLTTAEKEEVDHILAGAE